MIIYHHYHHHQQQQKEVLFLKFQKKYWIFLFLLSNYVIIHQFLEILFMNLYHLIFLMLWNFLQQNDRYDSSGDYIMDGDDNNGDNDNVDNGDNDD